MIALVKGLVPSIGQGQDMVTIVWPMADRCIY